MSKTKSLHAEPRLRTGSGSLKQMRREGWLPCNVYGRGVENRNIKVNSKTFTDILSHSASDNILLNLEVAEEATIMAFLQDVQHDPLTGNLVHADFRAVDDKTEITASLPVEMLGESAGVKAGGVQEVILHSLEIRCLPKDLPERIELDVTELEIGDNILVRDIDLGEGVSMTQGADLVVAQVVKTRIIEEDEDELEGIEGEAIEGEEGAVTEPEVLSEKKEEE